MPDWRESMTQTFEYYVVDPGTWKDVRKLDNVKKCTINRDSSAETLGSATIDVTETVGECYVRVYMITIQNGVEEKHPLGTYLVQTPSSEFDGKTRNVSMDAYTPLLELKEKQPPIGYTIPKGQNAMTVAYQTIREQARAPVSKIEDSTAILQYDFVAETNDTWLTYLSDLIANNKYVFDLDEMGRILFAPKQDTASLQPVWTYEDNEVSILHSNISMDHDLYGIPNVVEVSYSSGTKNFSVTARNDDPNSPTSTVNRGREIVRRLSNQDVTEYFILEPGNEAQLQEYANQLLRTLSTIEYTITYTHGYCPVRVMDCIRMNYSKAGLTGIKAKVIKQSIECDQGCPVTETAVFTAKLWG